MRRRRVAVLGAVAIALAIAAIVLWPRSRTLNHAVVARVVAPRPPSPRIDPETLPSATIDGLVHDAAQKPLAGARVCAVHHADRTCTSSATDGRFALAVAPGDIAIGASLARHAPRRIELTRLDQGDHRTVDVALDGGAVEVKGAVVDIGGQPIEHAHVTANSLDDAETDAQGKFALWAPADSPLVFLDVRAPGYGPRHDPVRPGAPFTISLAPASTIAGKVVDAATGAPISDAHVTVGSRGDEVTTAADGTFTVGDLAAGELSIEAATPTGYGRYDRKLTIGIGEHVDGVVVKLQPARSVVATIEIAGDRTICNPTPVLWGPAIKLEPWRDGEGRYHFDGVPPGSYSVHVPGCETSAPPVLVDDRDLDVRWRVEASAPIAPRPSTGFGPKPVHANARTEVKHVRGLVVNERALPVAGAIVIADRDALVIGVIPQHTMTDELGRFTLRATTEKVRVGVYRRGGGQTTAIAMASETPLILLRTATAQLAGTVLSADGTPAPRFHLRIRHGDATFMQRFDYTGGRFAIDDLGEYPFTLAALVNDHSGEPITITADTPKSGLVLRLPKAVAITGRIVDSGTRTPIANVRVMPSGYDDKTSFTTDGPQQTDTNGGFTLRDLPPGPLKLQLDPDSDAWSSQIVYIQVPDAPGDVGELGLARKGKR